LDACLLAAAKAAGCDVQEGVRAVEVDIGRSTARLSSGAVLKFAIIVGADGVHSLVRKSLAPHKERRNSGMGFGLVGDVPLSLLRGTPDCYSVPHIHFGVVPWGYGWLFPKGDHVCIGVGGAVNKVKNFRRPFEKLVDSNCVPETGTKIGVRGQHVPFGWFETRPGCGHALLLGDAAGMVEPVTGEGIALAVESASLAAEAIARSYTLGKPLKAGDLYNAACRQELLPRLVQARRARWLLFPRPCLPLAMRALHRHPELVAWYLDVLAGRMTYWDYFRRMMSRPWRRGHEKEDNL
jgi:flavin-dependent dehydrogenase